MLMKPYLTKVLTFKININLPNVSRKCPSRILTQYRIVNSVRLFSFRSSLDLKTESRELEAFELGQKMFETCLLIKDCFDSYISPLEMLLLKSALREFKQTRNRTHTRILMVHRKTYKNGSLMTTSTVKTFCQTTESKFFRIDTTYKRSELVELGPAGLQSPKRVMSLETG